MADLATVERFILNAVVGALYSHAYTPYSVVTSDIGATTGLQFRAMRGWPIDSQLNLDLLANIVNINVFSMPGARNTTRFLRQMTTTPVVVPDLTMTATLVDHTITFAGTADIREVIGMAIPLAGFSMRLDANSTPTTVAAAFAANMPNATSTGPAVTVHTNEPIRVDLGMDVSISTEVHRQCGYWKVGVWSPTTEARDLFSGQLDAGLQFIDRFFFDDGSVSGSIINAGGMVDDKPEKANLWRRDLHYEIEYPTTYVQIVPIMVLGELVDPLNTHYV